MEKKPEHLKIKALPPSLREKAHYVAFEIISESGRRIPFSDFSREFEKSFFSLAGALSYARANPKALFDTFDSDSGTGIIKVERGYDEMLRAALCTIKSIKVDNSAEESLIVESITTSGSIRKAKRRINERLTKNSGKLSL